MAKNSEVKEEEAVTCDNHPDRVAVLNSDLNGAIQPIRLCEECVNNANLQKFV